jgi:signal transduction histidine kinase
MRNLALSLFVGLCCADGSHVVVAQATSQVSSQTSLPTSSQAQSAKTSSPKAAKLLFAEYALPRPTHGLLAVDSLTALLPSKQGKARLPILDELTREYLWQSLDLAKQYQAEALALAQAQRDSVAYAKALLNAGSIERLSFTGDGGFQSYHNALVLCQRIGDRHGLTSAIYYLGIVSSERGEMLQARSYLLQALQLADSLGDVYVAARVNNAISEDYLEEGELEKALDFSLRSLALHRRDTLNANRDFRLLIQLNNVGEIYRNRKEYGSALKYFVEGHELILSCGWRLWHRMANSCGNLSRTYDGMGRYDEAILWGKRSVYEEYRNMERFQDTQLGRRAFVGSAFRLLALAYRGAGKADSALIYFKKSAELPGMDDVWMVELHSEIVALYLQRGDIHNALSHARRARDMAENLGTLSAKIMAAKAMADAFSAAKQFDTAFAYSSRYAVLNDSLRNLEKAKQAERMQARFDVAVKQKENDLLRRENEMKELVISRQTMTVLGVTAFLIITVALLLLLYRANGSNKRTRQRVQIMNTTLNETLQDLRETQGELEQTNTILQEKNELLEKRNAEKTELLSIVSHDLKNPLTAINGFTEIISSDLPLDHNLQPIARHIHATVDRMNTLVRNLLDSAAIELGNITVRKQTVSLPLLVLGILDRYTIAAQSKQQRFRTHVTSEAASAEVVGDMGYLEQVFDNLISNAVKYSPLGGLITVRILLVGAGGDRIRVEVQDEGVGLSADDQAKLFGFFQRLSTQPTGGESSNGVGLAVVKKIVELHNGAIWCESDKDRGIAGATFIVELPQAV